MDRNVEIAYKILKEPIDANMRCPVELLDIAEYTTAEPGEIIKNYTSEDGNTDDIYTADAAGGLTIHKVSAVAPAQLTFVGLQSKLEYVLIDEINDAEDQNGLARKKLGIIRAMDKMEVKRVLDMILLLSTQEVDKDSGGDILDTIIKMKQKVEDYATDYILLVGATIQSKIDTYDKEHVTTFNYKMNISEELAKLGIKKVVKVIGLVNGASVFSATKAILVGRNSNLSQGKPITVIRRKFNAKIAAMSGVEGTPERLVSVAETPTIINADGLNTLGYGTYGYSKIIECVTDKRAISWSDNLY
ncbi:MAG: hypothetical protein V1901_03755 [Patescibacteria group bacterium]